MVHLGSKARNGNSKQCHKEALPTRREQQKKPMLISLVIIGPKLLVLGWSKLQFARTGSPSYRIMTRSVKANDRNHAGLADGTAIPEDRLPRYFAKSGHVDADPKSIKKSGSGKGNWGRDGDEVHDYGYNFTNERRRSNSTTQSLTDFKTKFEGVDDPVFEEDVHGPTEEDIEKASTLSKEESNDSSSYGGSVTEDDGFRKM